jgi:dTDP-6-deoxy-L-talose 4-dehydrogenase (NAD+)
MKIAVTGATGFIGGHVLADLAARDIEVVAACRQATAGFPSTPGLKTVAMDMKDANEESFDLLGRPDALIHLAWGGLPNYRSLHHFEMELPQQYRFLSTLVRSGLGCLVVAGTCFEYGMQSGELSETLEPRPDNPYGFAKDALRRQLEFLHQTNPFALSWGRLFYLYGEGQSPASLLPLLRCAVEQGEPTFNMSGGEQLRDYLPASDVARHLVDLAVGNADIGVVNISSGAPISIRKLVEGWIAENGWDITPNYGFYPYPDYEPMAFWGNCQKLQRASGTQ